MNDLFDQMAEPIEFVPETEIEPGMERFRHVKRCARCGGTGDDRAYERDEETGHEVHWAIRMTLASLRKGHLCTRCADPKHPAHNLPLKPRDHA